MALLEQVELWKGSVGGCHLHPQTRVKREVEVGRKESEPPSLQIVLVVDSWKKFSANVFFQFDAHFRFDAHFQFHNVFFPLLCLLMGN